VADSSFKGAAMVFSANCQYIVLDSVTLENFNIGMLVNNHALHLNQVQFKNCSHPVVMSLPYQNILAAPDNTADSAQARTDSAKTRNSK
jgi:hypothetical protein